MTTLKLADPRDPGIVPTEPARVGTTPGGLDLQDRVRCEVCDHNWDEHDPISRRYCEATQMNALSRHCICPNTA